MKNRIISVAITILLLSNNIAIAHLQPMHQYITNEAFKLLKMRYANRLSFISTLEQHMPTENQNLSTYESKNARFSESKVVASAYDEDVWDAFYMNEVNYPPTVTPYYSTVAGFFSPIDPYNSITHFWKADNGDGERTSFQWQTQGIDCSISAVPNAYEKAVAYCNGIKFFIPYNFNYSGTNPLDFAKTGGGGINVLSSLSQNNGLIKIEYDNLQQLYSGNVRLRWAFDFRPANPDWSPQYNITLSETQRDFLIYEVLGRICHLIQDQSVPAHTHKDIHGSTTNGIGTDYYEETYIPSLYSAWTATSADSVLNPYQWTSNNPLHFLFYTTNQIAEYYYSNGPYETIEIPGWGGNVTQDELTYLNYHRNSPLFNYYPGPGGPDNPTKAYPIANTCMNQAIRATAGIMLWFINQINGSQQLLTKIDLSQKLVDNSLIGSIWKWNGTLFEDLGSISAPNLQFASTQTFKPDNTVHSNQKFYNWEEISSANNFLKISKLVEQIPTRYTSRFMPTYNARIQSQLIDDNNQKGPIEFKDPWLADFQDQYYGSTYRNQGMIAPYLSVPYDPNLNNYNIGISTSHQGVFLGLDPQQTSSYYLINAPSQNINGFNALFSYWSTTNASVQSATLASTYVVFNSSGASVTANYKAHHASSLNTGLVNGGQHKILRTPDGTLHTVYESAGKVWYEWKPSSSSNWELAGLTDVAGSEAKSPSITSRGNNVIIVYQKKNGNNYDIEFKMFETGGGGETPVVIASNLGLYTDDAQPVAASNSAGRIYFAWKQASNSGDAGIHYNAGLVSTQGEYSNAYSGKITNTSSSSSSPSVAVGSIADGNPWYHYPLVWTEGSAIYYVDVQYRSNSGWQNYNSYGTTISAGSGYTYNYNPSVICYGATNVRATWIGRRYESDPGEGMSKQQAGGGGTWVTRVIYNNQDAPGTFEVYGENVNSVNINKNNNGSDVSHVVAWSANSGTEAHCRTSEGYGGEFKIGSGQINGKDVQLSNGTSFTDMHGFMLDGSTSAPYKLKLSDNDISQMSKTQFAAVNNGREGSVRDSSAGFYFAIGDVTVDDASITFDGNPDTIKKYSVSMLNSTLESRPFALGNNSNFVYSVQYGITDSAFAALVLKDGKTVNFKVQLIDDQTKAIIGEFDNVVFSAQNINQYKNIGYQVNTEGIGNRTVRLRLVVNAYSEAQFALSNRYNKESIINLGKQGSQRTETGFRGSVEIKEYALSQNFPNPFNPSTTINYALPKAGNVVLKVYDVLGKEVATLVNNYKESGRYFVEFDASKLSSGMYVYKLTSDKYSEVKKMMLVR